MLALAIVAAAGAAEDSRELPLPAWGFGLIALTTFALLLGVTYSFKSAATKHAGQGAEVHDNDVTHHG